MLVSTVTRSPPLIEDNTADKRETKKKEKQYEADKKTDQRGAELNRTQHQEENKNKREHGGKKQKTLREPMQRRGKCANYRGNGGVRLPPPP